MSFHRVPTSEQIKSFLARAELEGADVIVVKRLETLLHFAEQKYSVTDTCRQFGISKSTLHRWLERFDLNDIASLRDKSHKPLQVRQSAVSQHVVDCIRQYRIRDMYIGKARIAELLQTEHGVEISPSSVGRIIERECLYFADTPLHWKKRLAHQTKQELPRPEVTPIVVVPEPENIPAERKDTNDKNPLLSWQYIKRFIIVSSVITNIAFVVFLISMALFERDVDIQQRLYTEQQGILHAAPSINFIP